MNLYTKMGKSKPRSPTEIDHISKNTELGTNWGLHFLKLHCIWVKKKHNSSGGKNGIFQKLRKKKKNDPIIYYM